MSGKQATTVSISPAATRLLQLLRSSTCRHRVHVLPLIKCLRPARRMPARAAIPEMRRQTLADGLFRREDLGLALGDHVAERRTLEAPVLEGKPDDRGQDEEADGDPERLVVRRLDADEEDEHHRDHRKDRERVVNSSRPMSHGPISVPLRRAVASRARSARRRRGTGRSPCRRPRWCRPRCRRPRRATSPRRTARRIAPVQIAATGVRYVGLTLASAAEPGSPPSRANAKIMREADVTVARPQRSCDDEDDDDRGSLDHRAQLLVERPEEDVPALLGRVVHVGDHRARRRSHEQ